MMNPFGAARPRPRDPQRRSPKQKQNQPQQQQHRGLEIGPDRRIRRMVCISMVASLMPYFVGTEAFSSTMMTPTPSPKSVGITSTLLESVLGTGTTAPTSHETDRLANTNPQRTKLRAAVYQPPIATAVQGDGDDNNETSPLTVLTKVADVLRLASRCGIDVVQFPELFLNEGLFRDVVSGKSAPLDRESYALNIVGNLCAELNVACVMGYAEAKHESENESLGRKGGCYSSLAIYHADGSRAGNYRCLRPSDPSTNEGSNFAFEKGHPLVEAMPISVKLPTRPHELAAKAKGPTSIPREVKLGAMCGGDLLVPEHARHLARSGAEMLAVSGSFSDGENNRSAYSRVAKHVAPTRCLENELPLLFSNYVDDQKEENEGDDDGGDEGEPLVPCFVGQSAILSCDGTELVRAPESLYGDMPSGEGYFLPCEAGGALYAANLEVGTNGSSNSIGVGTIVASIDDWELAPRIEELGDVQKGSSKFETEPGFWNENRKKSKGFGREVVEVLEQNKKKKQRLKNK